MFWKYLQLTVTLLIRQVSFVESINECAVGVGYQQAPIALSKAAVIENALQMAGIEHTPVEHMDIQM